MRGKWIVLGPLAIVGMAIFIALGGLLVMLLWNWLLPGLFHWPQLGFWQAVGLLALARILFGGHGWRGSGRSGIRRRMRERMAERWDGLTPEDREKFREAFRARWGCVPPSRDGEPGANPGRTEPPRGEG